MELTKISTVRLAIVSVVSAFLCLASIGMLGYVFSSYFKYDINKQEGEAKLTKLTNEIEKLEIELQERRKAMDQLEEKWQEFRSLTNDIKLSVVEQEALCNKIDELKKTATELDAELATTKMALDLTKEMLRTSRDNLAALKEEINEGERRKVEFAGLENQVASKMQEVKTLDEKIAAKTKNHEEIAIEVDKMQKQLAQGNANLAEVVVRAEGEAKIIEERQKTIAHLQSTITSLEKQTAAAKTELEEIDKNLQVQSPKEEALAKKIAELEGQYLDATNKLEQARIQLKKETEDARIGIDNYIQQKIQETERKSAVAKATLSEMEDKATEIITEAKAFAVKIESTAASDKEASEKAVAERLTAQAETKKLEKERGVLLEMIEEIKKTKSSLEAEKKLTETAATEAKNEESTVKIRLAELKADEKGLSQRIAEMRETLRKLEVEIAEAIKAREKIYSVDSNK